MTTTDFAEPVPDAAAVNRAAGYTGLGVAEFAALALHEQRDGAVATLTMLGLADAAMADEITLALGRSGLVARGLMSFDGEGVEPAGIGRLVAHACANATMWLSVVTIGGVGALDGLLVAIAPEGGLVLVRRALGSLQAAPADLEDGAAGLVLDMLEAHLAAEPAGSLGVTPTRADGTTLPTLLIRHARDGDAIDATRFEVATGHDLDTRPAESVEVVDEAGLDGLVLRAVQGDADAGTEAEANA